MLIHSLHTLKTENKFCIYVDQFHWTEDDLALCRSYLENLYDQESSDYPYTPPPFEASAALFGAKYIYVIAIYILQRRHSLEEIKAHLPKFEGEYTPQAMVSADIFLRYLPQLYSILEEINPEDPILTMIDEELLRWPFTRLLLHSIVQKPWEEFFLNDCISVLYIDRIIQMKYDSLATHPRIYVRILRALGAYVDSYWSNFITQNIENATH